MIQSRAIILHLFQNVGPERAVYTFEKIFLQRENVDAILGNLVGICVLSPVHLWCGFYSVHLTLVC